jgi:tetratricopeptide (TPR) repeat protein
MAVPEQPNAADILYQLQDHCIAYSTIKIYYMKKIICLFCIVTSLSVKAQTNLSKPRIIYGVCTKDSLLLAPFSNWFSPGYDDYKPNITSTSLLKKQAGDNISIDIFFGSWCGDSKREVPRFLKLLQEISFPANKVRLIGLGGSDSLTKQSPQHEEAGKGIFRVPTFIIYKNGTEINRINEFPVFSLEKDLLQIFSSQYYAPNYGSFSIIKKWLSDGTLTDENMNTAGLAQQLRQPVKDEHELNSLGYLLVKQDKRKEALRIFQINAYLYPESANVISSLGEGYYETGDYKKAIAFLERALELNKVPADIKGILDVLYKAKEKNK